jgi:hypothetical protein
VGRRSRQRAKEDQLVAPESAYRSPDGEAEIVLRGVMTPKTRAAYDDVLHGNVLSQEDAWHRAVEFLFERLAVRWEVSGVAATTQKELLQRFRAATRDERSWIRDVLREHVTEHFPGVEAP